MQYPVIVRPKSTDCYIAEPLGLTEVRVEAATESDAVAQVGEALGSWLGAARLYSVELPLHGGPPGNPWLETAGRSADDPQFEDYLAEIERARTAEDDAAT